MKQVFVVKDLAVQAYGLPIFQATAAEAMRSFTDACNQPDSIIAKHPEDYELYYIGTYDEQTGIMTQEDPQDVQRIARAKDIVQALRKE